MNWLQIPRFLSDLFYDFSLMRKDLLLKKKKEAFEKQFFEKRFGKNVALWNKCFSTDVHHKGIETTRNFAVKNTFVLESKILITTFRCATLFLY